jgi:hypothetical protein
MNTRTALTGVALVVVAVVLFLVLKGGGEDEDKLPVTGGAASTTGNSDKPKSGVAEPGGKGDAIPTIVIDQGGKPVGGVADLTYRHGEEVRFKVRSAVADEIHVHGYDLMEDVEAGGTVSFEFPAEIEGVFEAELEGRGEPIVELKVEP